MRISTRIPGTIFISVAAILIHACGLAAEGPPDYEAIFVQDRLVDWSISITSGALDRLLLDPGSYQEADVRVDEDLYGSVGLRFLGDVSRTKKSLRIRFNKFVAGQKLHGLKRLNLRNCANDPTLIREVLALSRMRSAGIPASRSSLVRVSVNGAPAGVYTLVEQVDKKFLADRFGEKEGNLYKLERGADLVFAGGEPADYDTGDYELKTNESENDRRDLAELVRVLNLASASDLEQELPRVLDVDGFLHLLAMSSWLSNLDWYPGAGGNLYLYHGADGRFRTIPWDLNLAFGNYHGKHCPHSTDDLLSLDPDSPTCGADRPLVDRLLEIPVFLETYHHHLAQLLDDELSAQAVLTEMDARRQLVTPHAHLDTLMGFTANEFDSSYTQDIPEEDPQRIPGLQPFILARDETLRRIAP